MFLDESIETASQKIKKAAGKPYSPGKKTLDTIATLAKGTRCALADAWK